MQAGLGEALVGYRVDADAGPIVVLAAGGVWAELADARSIRLAPVSLEDAREMVREVKALQRFAGRRGQRAADLESLARVIVSLSALAERELLVSEAEINPLLLQEHGVVALDALVYSSSPERDTPRLDP
jgi:acetate---CoA ligase (ADP-forming)